MRRPSHATATTPSCVPSPEVDSGPTTFAPPVRLMEHQVAMKVGLRETSLSPAETWQQVQSRLDGAPYYRLIRESYRGKVARRSGLPYINHIHEGVFVYVRLFGWAEHPVAAYCVHPVFQSDRSLQKAMRGEVDIGVLDREVVVLAMEYRRVANAYVSTMRVRPPDAISLSPLDGVNRMLVADKVQNKKDFMAHLFDRLDRPSYRRASRRYADYFDGWLSRLGVPPAVYDSLVRELDDAASGVVVT